MQHVVLGRAIGCLWQSVVGLQSPAFACWFQAPGLKQLTFALWPCGFWPLRPKLGARGVRVALRALGIGASSHALWPSSVALALLLLALGARAFAVGA